MGGGLARPLVMVGFPRQVILITYGMDQTWVHSRMPIQNNFPSIGFELLPNIWRANITWECLAVIQNLWRENYFEWAFMNGPKSTLYNNAHCQLVPTVPRNIKWVKNNATTVENKGNIETLRRRIKKM